MRLVTRILAPLALFFALLLPANAAFAAPAELEHGQESFISETNDCNGKLVVLEGTFHVTWKPQRHGGVNVLMALHAQGEDAQGNLYVLSHTFRGHGDTSFTQKATTLLVSKGSAPNKLAKLHFSFTPTDTELYDFEIVCRG